MGYIHCCGGLHKTRTFMLSPTENFVLCELERLSKCPLCGHFVLQLTRVDKMNNVSVIRYKNTKARRFWTRVKSKILCEKKALSVPVWKGTFYLNYNEYGIRKRCYSNFSNLKLGLS